VKRKVSDLFETISSKRSTARRTERPEEESKSNGSRDSLERLVELGGETRGSKGDLETKTRSTISFPDR